MMTMLRYSLKIRPLIRLWDQIWIRLGLFFAFKHHSNWTLSSTLAMDSSGLMPPIILPNTRISSYSRSSPGIGGDTVRFMHTGLQLQALISKNRHSCRLDVIIQWNDG